MRIKPICVSKQGAEVALELRPSFAFWQVCESTASDQRRARSPPGAGASAGSSCRSLSGKCGGLPTTGNCVEVDDKFLACSTRRNSMTGQRSSHKWPATAQLRPEAHPRASVAPGEEGQRGPGCRCPVSWPRAVGFLAEAQQLSPRVFGRTASRILPRLTTGVPPFVTPQTSFVTVARSLSFFPFSVLDLAAECCLLHTALQDDGEHGECLRIPLTGTGFRLQWGVPFLGFLTLGLPFFALPPASAFLAAGFLSQSATSQLFCPPSCGMGKSSKL